MSPLLRLCALLGLALAGPGSAADCPPGRTPVCLYGCICLPPFEQVREEALNLAADNLQRWIEQSRQSMLAAGSEPLPEHLRQRLLAYYPEALLEQVRFRVGGGEQLDVASAMLRNPDIRAVTLVDLIVFRSASDAQTDLALWAHELWHVQQYLAWGSAGFAQRYTRDHQAVEGPAYEIQARVGREQRQAR